MSSASSVSFSAARFRDLPVDLAAGFFASSSSTSDVFGVSVSATTEVLALKIGDGFVVGVAVEEAAKRAERRIPLAIFLTVDVGT